MRKLASIQKVLELNPIAGADRIEVASVLGWSVVVKKGEFAVGDPVIYCEIDSVLPEKPEFEFMRPRKFRVKTARLRGQLSQGLCFPVDILPSQDQDLSVGTDVTEILGIKKFVPKWAPRRPANIIGPRPSYVPKTDEPRIQSNIELLEEMRGKVCYVSTKIDGCSGTFLHLDGEVFCCSRNFSFRDEPGDRHWEAARKYSILEKLKEAGNYAVQGEIAGPGIQRNLLGLTEIDFFAFNVFDIQRGKYLDYEDFRAFCEKWEIPTVPVDDDSLVFNHSLPELLEMAKGSYASGNYREGIVIRPLKEQPSSALGGSRLSFKVINNDFLLKEK